MKEYTDSQLRNGGKKFNQILKCNPGATAEQLAEMTGEPIDKIQARLASREQFIANRQKEDAERRNRTVRLPKAERETEKGICFKMNFACEGYKTYKGDVDYENWSTPWMVWFPKSQLKLVDEIWFAPGWLFDRKIQECAFEVEARTCGRMGNWQVQKCTGLVDGEMVQWTRSGSVHDEPCVVAESASKSSQN